MTKIIYNKLIRDKIPEVIEKSGKSSKIRILNKSEYPQALKDKLLEEVNEFIGDDTVEELADIAEVLLAILKQRNISLDEFEAIRLKKQDKLGGFDKCFLLIETE
ncbi:MAG: nucleoside triphosphate pyrophosphohydrolase [Planctomycetaceae bacterium]|jgi:predicted house-cleaning noncanonical NTP pyrophosphatase (MazG superfamily)|nr:nucleoside triphosphate pyrophosphohydrolase [Planctomycetaceae bacterium]